MKPNALQKRGILRKRTTRRDQYLEAHRVLQEKGIIKPHELPVPPSKGSRVVDDEGSDAGADVELDA